jgi:RpiR family carbohydrate utilization transcriptional regulator
MSVYILDKITQQIDSLSRSEAHVARWILDNPHVAVESTIAQVAHAADVSEPTVIRFCRRIGLTGFRDLKPRLVANLQRPESYLHHDVNRRDSTVDAARKVLERSINSLVELREQLNDFPLEAAVDTLSEARQLVFVGIGASGIVAEDACHKFFRLGLPCSTALDAQTILQRAAIAQPGDVYLAISHTGRWPELVRAISLASDRGARVLALTDPLAPLARHADFVIDCHPPEDTNIYTPMSSRLAQLALLDSLQVALALRLGPEVEEHLQNTKEVLQSDLPVSLG